jgi:hypothetical protein
MAKEIQILSEGETWETLQIRSTWDTWEIAKCHNNDVEISCDNDEGTTLLHLNQAELKQLITFLQSKVVQ